MEKDEIQAVAWEAPEFRYREKGKDWYVSVAIIFVCLIVAVSLFDFFNFIFLTLLSVACLSFMIMAAKKPSIIAYEVNNRGIRIGEEKISFRDLDSYYIDREDPFGTQMLIMRKERFSPLLVMPLPEEYIDEVEYLIENEIEEKELQEPIFMKLLEIFGF